MLLTDKIKTGVLKRANVEACLANFKARLAIETARAATLQGFERDWFFSSVLLPLNTDITTGELILKKMSELNY